MRQKGPLWKKKKTRTVRKKIKREQMFRRRRNKKLITKYPWLKPVSWFNFSPIKDEEFDLISLWDDVPKGWIKAFGEMMCDELDAEIGRFGARRKVWIDESKEKYGELRIYFSALPQDCKADDIVDKYTTLSRNICVNCGKPDVPCLDLGWISPWCEDCYQKTGHPKDAKYEDFAPDDKKYWKMQDTMKFTRFLPNSEKEEVVIDISETANKIRYQYNKRMEKQAKKRAKKLAKEQQKGETK